MLRTATARAAPYPEIRDAQPCRPRLRGPSLRSMRPRAPRALLVAALAATLAATGLLLPALPASAVVVVPLLGPASGTGGIAVGADGNLWVAEQTAGSLVRMTPSGSVLGRWPLGGQPTTVTTGPGGRIWVAVTGADQLAYVDSTAAAPTPVFISTASLSGCGPVGLTSGGDGRMYFTMPTDGSPGCTAPRLSSVAANHSFGAAVTGIGQAFDLAVSGGKLYVPDFEGDVVRRLSLGTAPAVEASIPTPGGPDGITTDAAGRLWVTAYTSGQLYRFAPTADTPTVVPLGGATLSSPYGVEAVGSRIHVASSGSHQLLSINDDTSGPVLVDLPGDAEPWQVAGTRDGDLFVTDQAQPRVLRVVDGAPRATTGTATATGSRTATVAGSVDPRGNATQVVVDYGPTTAYGASTAATTLPAGATAVPTSTLLSGLAPGTTYHVRVRATNALGTTVGADTVLRTPRAAARLSSTRAPDGRTRITGLVVKKLGKGDKVTLHCRGGGCAARASTKVTVARRGTLSLGPAVKGLVLAPGARLVVTVRAKKGASTAVTFTMVRGRKPTTS